MVTICIILWIAYFIDQASEDRSYYDRKQERRYRELLEAEERRLDEYYETQMEIEQLQKKKPKIRTIVREIVDEQGRVIRETITEEI